MKERETRLHPDEDVSDPPGPHSSFPRLCSDPDHPATPQSNRNHRSGHSARTQKNQRLSGFVGLIVRSMISAVGGSRSEWMTLAATSAGWMKQAGS